MDHFDSEFNISLIIDVVFYAPWEYLTITLILEMSNYGFRILGRGSFFRFYLNEARILSYPAFSEHYYQNIVKFIRHFSPFSLSIINDMHWKMVLTKEIIAILAVP